MKMTGIKAIMIEKGVEYAVEMLSKLLDDLMAELRGAPSGTDSDKPDGDTSLADEVKNG